MKYTLMLFMVTSISIVSSAQKTQKEIKQQEQNEQYQLVKELVQSGKLEFIGIRAIPSKGGQVDLTTRSNFVRIDAGNVSASLPYIGVAHNPTLAINSGGVVFDGVPESYQVDENDKKLRVLIKFKIKEKGEIYNCILTISSLNNAKLSVTSTVRSSISYIGGIGPLKVSDNR